MKCPNCQNKMQKVTDFIEEDGIEFQAMRCNKCEEEIMTMPQLRSLSKKYRKLRKAKEISFAKWGNSLALRIPKDIVDEYDLSAGKHAILTKDKEGIKIIPSP